MYYTYAHYTPEGRLFYIGKGSSVRRSQYLLGRNNYWNKIVAKYGAPVIKILGEWDVESDALLHEKLLISTFRFLGYKLCNLTNGGEGTSGYKHTPEHIEKNRLARLGKSATWNIGRRHSEETRKKCGAANVGRPTSAKQKAIASAIFKGNKFAVNNTTNRTWIWVGTNIKTGEVVKFIGEKEMKEAGLQHANIIKCLNGERKSHKGYTWQRETWSKN